ncbi:MAG: protease modulator HflK N-terminal domain-containing protein [Pseudomonadota bacterium]
MSWNNNSGGGGWKSGGGNNGGGPWGQPPGGGGNNGGGPWGQGSGGGGGNQQQPDLEEILKRGQDRYVRLRAVVCRSSGCSSFLQPSARF